MMMMYLPILEFDQFHVENFDGFESLNDRIEYQSNAVLR